MKAKFQHCEEGCCAFVNRDVMKAKFQHCEEGCNES